MRKREKLDAKDFSRKDRVVLRSSHKQENIVHFGQKEFHHLAEQAEQKTNFELADEFGLAFKDLQPFKKMINRN